MYVSQKTLGLVYLFINSSFINFCNYISEISSIKSQDHSISYISWNDFKNVLNPDVELWKVKTDK